MPKYLSELRAEQWGPSFWKLLHVLSTRMGGGDEMADGDAANYMFFVVNRIHEVIPCLDCQGHAKAYLSSNKFDPRGLNGLALRNYVEKWLMDFHNAVRRRKGAPIVVDNLEAYHAFWRPLRILAADDDSLKDFFGYGKMYKIVRLDNFARWASQLTRLRLLLHL
jgi:hypothetical protein